MHFAHYVPAMDGRGDLAHSERRGDLFCKHAGNNEVHYLALTDSQLLVSFSQLCNLGLSLPQLVVALQGLLNRIDEILIPEGLCQKLYRPRFHGFDSHGDVSVAGDEDDRDANSPLIQFAMDIQSAHSRQAHVQNEATGGIWKLVTEEVLRRGK